MIGAPLCIDTAHDLARAIATAPAKGSVGFAHPLPLARGTFH